jgi:hypothetical protein
LRLLGHNSLFSPFLVTLISNVELFYNYDPDSYTRFMIAPFAFFLL